MNAPQIPLEVFRKMVATLPPDQLARIPAEKLPDQIPLELIEEAPPESARTLETLILRHQSWVVQVREKLRQRLGPVAHGAWQLSHRPLREFALNRLYKQLQRYARLKRGHRQQPRLEADIALYDTLRDLEDLAIETEGELRRIEDYRAQLKHLRLDEAELDTIVRETRRDLYRLARLHCKVLGRYHLERLEIATRIMADYHRRIEAQSAERERLLAQQRLLRHQLEAAQPGERDAHRFRQGLRQTLLEINQRLHQLAVPLGENELEEWLDVLVSVAIRPALRRRHASLYAQAEKHLVYLMRHYLTSHDGQAAAQERNPFLPISPERVMSFETRSTAFLLDYFRNRERHASASLCAPRAEQQAELERLRKLLLKDIRLH